MGLAGYQTVHQSVALEPLQTVSEHLDPAVVAGVTAWRRHGNGLCFSTSSLTARVDTESFHTYLRFQETQGPALSGSSGCWWTYQAVFHERLIVRMMVSGGLWLSKESSPSSWHRHVSQDGSLQLSAANGSSTMDIQGVAGKSIPIADCLLRVLLCTVHLGVYFSAMADQPDDPDILAIRLRHTGLKLEDTVMQEGSVALLCNVSNGRPCPFAPVAWGY